MICQLNSLDDQVANENVSTFVIYDLICRCLQYWFLYNISFTLLTTNRNRDRSGSVDIKCPPAKQLFSYFTNGLVQLSIRNLEKRLWLKGWLKAYPFRNVIHLQVVITALGINSSIHSLAAMRQLFTFEKFNVISSSHEISRYK